MSSESENGNTPKVTGRHYIVTLLLAMFLGCFGAHRFYTGYIGIGIIQVLTGWCPIWAFIDLIAIALNKFKDVDGKELDSANSGCGLMVLIYIIGMALASVLTLVISLSSVK